MTLQYGFEVIKLVEPKRAPHLMDEPGVKDELHRPMMHLIAAVEN